MCDDLIKKVKKRIWGIALDAYFHPYEWGVSNYDPDMYMLIRAIDKRNTTGLAGRLLPYDIVHQKNTIKC